MDQFKQKLGALADLFEQAEKQVKKAEEINNGMVVPSINELRYFGYHIIKAFLSESNQDLETEIKKAEGHAKRSIYDASEALIIFYLEKAENFHKRHAESDSVTDVIPNYVELLTKLEEIKARIAEIREDQSAYTNRAEYYQDCYPYIDELGSINLTFKQANHLIIKKDRKKARNTILAAGSLLVGALGLILTIFLSSNKTDGNTTGHTPQQEVQSEKY